MNETVKKKWLAALRSGDYRQGKSALRPSTKHFCCLGILCDLYIKDHPGYAWDEGEIIAKSAHLPDLVIEWAGLRDYDYNPTVGIGLRPRMSLAKLNDSGVSFKKIADGIESSL